MFDRIDQKIQGMAAIILFIGLAVSIITACFQWKNEAIGLGFAALFGGAFLSVLVSWLIYGFGELIETANKIEDNTRKHTAYSEGYVLDDSEEK